MHGPGDLAAEVLLGVEDDPRHRRAEVVWRRRPSAGADRAACRRAGSCPRRHRWPGHSRSASSARVSRKRPSVLRLPSRTSTWASMTAARRVSVISWALSAVTSSGGRLTPAELLDELDALLLMAPGLRRGLGDEHVDLGELAVERGDVRGQPVTEVASGASLGCGIGDGRAFRGGHWCALSPPASGSSPGASRTPRPVSGR